MERKEAEEYFGRAVAAIEGLALKGKKMRYLSMNGNMYAFLDPEGDISLRFGKEELAAFTAEFDAKPSIQYGSVMRGYAIVPERVVRDEPVFLQWLERCHAFAQTLKAKPTKKPAAKKAAAKKPAAKKPPAKKVPTKGPASK